MHQRGNTESPYRAPLSYWISKKRAIRIRKLGDGSWVTRAASSATTNTPRVEFRGIGRQELQPESATLLAHEVPYHATAVTGVTRPIRSAACRECDGAGGRETR